MRDECALVAEFLHDRGYTLETVRALRPPEAHVLLEYASVYASCRPTEVESRARYVHEIHHVRDRSD